MTSLVETILLEQEQKELLTKLVEASRNVSREERQKFMLIRVMSGSFIRHPGIPGRNLSAYEGDVEMLGGTGLLAITYGSKETPLFDVTPLGFRYYEQLKQQAGQPIQRIEATVREYLQSNDFQKKYPAAYQKWSEAEAMLWNSDSERQLTTVGHLCREALQEFAVVLVDTYKPSNVDNDKTHTVARLRAILNHRKSTLGTSEAPFLDALLVFWGTVSDLVQRQEHGSQKEGQPLIWEDGRRVVFQSVVVMFEIDKSLS